MDRLFEFEKPEPKTYSVVEQAGRAMKAAISDGRLVPQACFMCGDTKVDGHHSSYAPDMWLAVTWLCRRHHYSCHAKQRADKRWLDVKMKRG